MRYKYRLPNTPTHNGILHRTYSRHILNMRTSMERFTGPAVPTPPLRSPPSAQQSTEPLHTTTPTPTGSPPTPVAMKYTQLSCTKHHLPPQPQLFPAVAGLPRQRNKKVGSMILSLAYLVTRNR